MTMKKLISLDLRKERNLVSKLLLISDQPSLEIDNENFPAWNDLSGWNSSLPQHGISMYHAREKRRKKNRGGEFQKPDDTSSSWRKVSRVNLEDTPPKLPEIKNKPENKKTTESETPAVRDKKIKSIKKIVANHSHSAGENGCGEKSVKSNKSTPRKLVPKPIIIEDVRAQERNELSKAKFKVLMQKIPNLNQQIIDDSRLLERLSSRSQLLAKKCNPCHISLHYDKKGAELRRNSKSKENSARWKSRDSCKSPTLAKKIISQSKLFQLQKSKRNAELYGRKDDYLRHTFGRKDDAYKVNNLNPENMLRDKSLSPLLVSVFRNENRRSFNIPLNLKNRIKTFDENDNFAPLDEVIPTPENSVIREMPILNAQRETRSDILPVQTKSQQYDWKFSPILPPILKHGDKVLNREVHHKSLKKHSSNVTVITQGRQKAGMSSTSINKIKRAQLVRPTESTHIVLPHILGEKTRSDLNMVRHMYRGS